MMSRHPWFDNSSTLYFKPVGSNGPWQDFGTIEPFNPVLERNTMPHDSQGNELKVGDRVCCIAQRIEAFMIQPTQATIDANETAGGRFNSLSPYHFKCFGTVKAVQPREETCNCTVEMDSHLDYPETVTGNTKFFTLVPQEQAGEPEAAAEAETPSDQGSEQAATAGQGEAAQEPVAEAAGAAT